MIYGDYSGAASPLGQPGHRPVALEGHGQGLVGIDRLLAPGGEVGADGGKRLGAIFAAEAAGDFLLELTSADVAFGLAVVEGRAQVGDEAQDLIAVLAQAGDQVVGGRLFEAWALARGCVAAGVATRALGEQGLVAGEEVLDHHARQGGEPGRTGHAGGRARLAQQCDQLLRPRQPGVRLGDADQLAQMVGVAEGVLTGVSRVGRPVVVDRDALVRRQAGRWPPRRRARAWHARRKRSGWRCTAHAATAGPR